MGDAADYDIERRENAAMYPFGVDILFCDSVRDKNRSILAEYEWTTKTGLRVKLKNMALSHLLNVVKMQERGNHRFSGQMRDYYEYRVTLENRPEF